MYKVNNLKNDKLNLIAINGSEFRLFRNKKNSKTYLTNRSDKGYNILHVNTMYDIEKNIFLDVRIQNKMEYRDHRGLVEMIDNSNLSKSLIITDRGYESYNNIQEKGWYFLIRIKDKDEIKREFTLPEVDSYDVSFNLKISRKTTNEFKELYKNNNEYKFIPSNTTFDYLPKENLRYQDGEFYEIKFRIVRFKIDDDKYESIVTNLPLE